LPIPETATLPVPPRFSVPSLGMQLDPGRHSLSYPAPVHEPVRIPKLASPATALNPPPRHPSGIRHPFHLCRRFSCPFCRSDPTPSRRPVAIPPPFAPRHSALSPSDNPQERFPRAGRPTYHLARYPVGAAASRSHTASSTSPSPRSSRATPGYFPMRPAWYSPHTSCQRNY
jgi:hypothetical protein